MIIYRKGKLPYIYSELSRIRIRKRQFIIDNEELIDEINELKQIYTSDKCISSWDGSGYLFVAVEMPDLILSLNGKTNEEYQIKKYYYRTYDVILEFINNIKIHNSQKILDTNLDEKKLLEIFDSSSCLKLLNDTKNHYYNLKTEKDDIGIDKIDIIKIKEIEKKVIARYNLENYAIQKNRNLNKKINRGSRIISPSLRNIILQRDNYLCIFCGQNSTMTALEIKHIIPVSLIKKLELDKSLVSDEINLCTTCFQCNRGKSDFLTKIDIDFYIKYVTKIDPTRKIVNYLLDLRKMQNYGR